MTHEECLSMRNKIITRNTYAHYVCEHLLATISDCFGDRKFSHIPSLCCQNLTPS